MSKESLDPISYLDAIRIVHGEHQQQEITVGLRRHRAIRIPYSDKADADRLRAALETLVGRDAVKEGGWKKGSFIVAEERHVNALLVQQKNYRLAYDPEWYRYEILDSLGANNRFVPEGTGKEVYRKEDFAIIEPSGYRNIDNVTINPERWPIGKIHLSVQAEDLPKAWNLIAPDILQSKLDVQVKVMNAKGLDRVQTAQPGARGKNIVLYYDKTNRDDRAGWERLLTRIERVLAENGIRPGENIPDEHAIAGSQGYFFGREGNTKYHLSGPRSGYAMNPFTPEPDSFLASLQIGRGTAETDRKPSWGDRFPPGNPRLAPGGSLFKA